MLRTVAFVAVFVLGGPMVFFGVGVYTPGGPLVAGAAALVYLIVVVALRIALWGRPSEMTSGVLRRGVVFLAVLIFGGMQLLAWTPGGVVEKGAALAVFTCAVVALRVAVWGWRD